MRSSGRTSNDLETATSCNAGLKSPGDFIGSSIGSMSSDQPKYKFSVLGSLNWVFIFISD